MELINWQASLMQRLLSPCLPQFNHCPPFSLCKRTETLPPALATPSATRNSGTSMSTHSALQLLSLRSPIPFLSSDHCSSAHLSPCSLNAIILQGGIAVPRICTPGPYPVTLPMPQRHQHFQIQISSLNSLRAQGWHFHLCAWHLQKGKVNHRSDTAERWTKEELR